LETERFTIKKLKQSDLEDFQKLISVFNEVFETDTPDIASESHLKKLLSDHNFMALAAFENEDIIGGLTAYEMPMYTADCSELYIYDLAVKKDLQRHGIGKKLISALKDYCRLHDIKTIFVEAHKEDKDAINFYHSANGEPEKVIHFNFKIGRNQR
jgi:aminoglycoside 3-N-acetyltransferase I